MRYLLAFILFAVSLAGYSQSTVYLKGDTISMEKTGGNANLKIKNATRDSLNGVLINDGGGVTSFKRIRAISPSQFVVGTDTITITGAGGAVDNFVTADLSGIADRYHNFKNFNLTIDSLQSFTTNSYSGQDYTMIFQNGNSAALQYANSGLLILSELTMGKISSKPFITLKAQDDNSAYPQIGNIVSVWQDSIVLRSLRNNDTTQIYLGSLIPIGEPSTDFVLVQSSDGRLKKIDAAEFTGGGELAILKSHISTPIPFINQWSFTDTSYIIGTDTSRYIKWDTTAFTRVPRLDTAAMRADGLLNGSGSGGSGFSRFYIYYPTTGDSSVLIHNDSTFKVRPFRDSGAVSISVADDGALVFHVPTVPSGSILQDGNSFAAAMNIGTNDFNTLNFETNGTNRWAITPSGGLYRVGGTYGVPAAGSTTLMADTIFTSALRVNTGTSLTGFTGTSTAMSMKVGNATIAILSAVNATATSGNSFSISRGSNALTGNIGSAEFFIPSAPTSSSNATITAVRGSVGYGAGVDSAQFANLNGFYHAFNADDLWFSNSATPVGYQPFVNARGNNHFNYTTGTTAFGLPKATAATSLVDISALFGHNQLRLRTSYTPSATGDTNGATGQVAWDDNYIYIKTSAGWKRVALSTF